jgi:hypothetical protein
MRFPALTFPFVLSAVALFASGCTKSSSIQHVNMVPGADVAVQINAPTTALEVRNIGAEPADIVIEADKGFPAPQAALPPNGTWQHTFNGNVDILLHNRGKNTAYLQLFTPNWNQIRVALFPNGRQDQNMVVWIVRPQSEADYNETAAEEDPN